MNRTVFFLLAGGILLAASACETSPKIKGPTRLVVGQVVTLELEAGETFVQDDFSLTDADGRVYTHTDGEVAYSFVNDRRIRFVIPKGIAAGWAEIEVGAAGREPYLFNVEIVRLLGVLDQSGTLSLYGLDDPTTPLTTYEAGIGAGTLAFSSGLERLAAISRSPTGEVHFLSLGAEAIEPYAPSVEIQQTLGRGVLLSQGLLVASDRGVAYIKQQGAEVVLDRWLETGPAVSLAINKDRDRVVSVGHTADATRMNVLYRISASGTPLLSGAPVNLGGTAGGVVDVTLDPESVLGVAINTEDDTVLTLDLTQGSPSAAEHALPDGDEGPTRVAISPAGDRLVVLCGRSQTAVLYAVESSAVTLLESVVVAEGEGRVPTDLAFGPGNVIYVLLADGGISRLDAQSAPVVASEVRGASGNGGAALLVQP